MRLRFAPIGVLLLFFTSLPAFAQWDWGRPHPPRSGACFYKEHDFGGDFFCLRPGERWPSLPRGFNDRISSVRVFGGARLRVFTNDNFNGPSLIIDHDIFDLRRVPVGPNPFKSWNDRISSLAVFTGRDEWEDRYRGPAAVMPPPPPGPPREEDWHRFPWRSGERDSACEAHPREGSHWCDNFRDVHEARPVREFGRRPCEFNRNWGVDRGRLWVSDGCGAVFEYR